MTKKNKVENSLERLFSTKKSDLSIFNQETTQPSQSAEEVKPVPAPVIKPVEKPAAPIAKSVEKKEKAAPVKKEKNEEAKPLPPKSTPEEVKPAPPVVEVAPEPVKKNSAPVMEKKITVVEEDKSNLDVPMTNAIVASKSEASYDTDEHLVIFSLAGQAYGISIMIVESIIKMQDITWVPRAHPSIEGATNLRGVVLPVINLCHKLGLTVSDDHENSRIIVVAVQDVTAGFVVDNVESVYQIAASEISPPSPMVSSINTKYIKGIAKNGDQGLVILLDPVKIFESIVGETVDKNQITLLR
jgi:purine-binding chemotaxis protein CheW